MKFFFHLLQHTPAGRRSLEDVIAVVIHQLRALGHTALWDPENDLKSHPEFVLGSDCYNVVVEGFTPGVTAYLASKHAQGAKFLCLATEEPTERGFNHGTQEEMVRRQAEFPNAMRYFDGILHLVPGARVTEWYSRFAPAAYAELGYVSALVKPDRVPEPEFLFGFYGSLTPRRLRLLKKLTNFVNHPKAVRIVADFTTGDERDAVMQNARVILQVRKFDEMGLVSSSRCARALSVGRPVVAEPHDVALSKPWDEIVKFTTSEDAFLLTARMALRSWRALHREQFRAFATRLTPEVCLGRALRQLGLGQPARRAA